MTPVAPSIMVTLWHSFARGRRETRTWREFIDLFVAQPQVVRDKRQPAGISFGTFVENRRALARVERVFAVMDRG